MRERQPGVWEVEVSVGRDPVTQAPKPVSRVVRAGGPTKSGRPPKTVTDLVHQLVAEAAKGQLHGTSATLIKAYSAFFPPADVEAAEHVGRLLSPS